MANHQDTIDENKLAELQGKVLTDVAGSMGLIMASNGRILLIID